MQMLVHFLKLLSSVYQQNIGKCDTDVKQYVSQKSWSNVVISMKELKTVQRGVCLLSVMTLQNKFTDVTTELFANNIPKQKLDR